MRREHYPRRRTRPSAVADITSDGVLFPESQEAAGGEGARERRGRRRPGPGSFPPCPGRDDRCPATRARIAGSLRRAASRRRADDHHVVHHRDDDGAWRFQPCTVVVHNPGAAPVLFKVKALHPDEVFVKPNQGAIAAGDDIELTLTFKHPDVAKTSAPRLNELPCSPSRATPGTRSRATPRAEQSPVFRRASVRRGGQTPRVPRA